MRIARFARGSDVGYGIVEDVQPAGAGLPAVSSETGALVVAELAGHPFGPGDQPVRLTGARHPLGDVRLLAPVLPSKVVAIGQNYETPVAGTGGGPGSLEMSAGELGSGAQGGGPVLFLKPSTAVIGPAEPIVYPAALSQRVEGEGTLAVVIGRLCRQVPPSRVPEVIFGYTCANDVTARDLQAADGQWARAKGFDTFCPLGPWIETGADPADLELTTVVNGEIRQNARTSQLRRDVTALVTFVSAVMTLLPGDVLLTGTPAGAGPLKDGDQVSVTIEGVGTLSNEVVSRD